MGPGRLDLSGLDIDDDEMGQIATLGRLEELDVSDTPLSDAGLHSLAGLKRLKRIWLLRTNTTPEGNAALRAALPGVSIDSDASLGEPGAQ